eukprot:4152261-Pyramimonas_sp.AAC.1
MKECVKPYEDRRNTAGGGRSCRRNSSKGATKVVATNTTKLRYDTFVGILWPVSVYRDWFKQKPPKKKVKGYRVGAKIARG